jgi:hypothetical protein
MHVLLRLFNRNLAGKGSIFLRMRMSYPSAIKNKKGAVPAFLGVRIILKLNFES